MSGRYSTYAFLTTPAANDVVLILDVSDPTMAATGTDKQITLANLLSLGTQVDSTAADIKDPGTQAAGTSSLAARADHVHAAPAVQPSDVQVLAWTSDPAMLNSSTAALAAGKLYLSAFFVRRSITISSMAVAIATAPTSLTSGQNFGGIYNSSGTQMGATADQTAAWGGGVGVYDMAITTPFTATAGMYWAALLSNGTTPPNFRGINSPISLIQLGQSAAQSRAGIFSSGLTALPASFTPSSIVQTNAILHAVVLH